MSDPSTPTPSAQPAEPTNVVNGTRPAEVAYASEPTPLRAVSGQSPATVSPIPTMSLRSEPAQPPAEASVEKPDAAPPPPPKTGSTRAVVMTVGVAVAVAALLASFAGPVGDRPALFASTDDLRAQLTTANTELKGLRETSAATERALAETRAALTAEQTKRQAAEKLVSDIKAVLGIAAPANDAATTPAGAAKAPTPAR